MRSAVLTRRGRRATGVIYGSPLVFPVLNNPAYRGARRPWGTAVASAPGVIRSLGQRLRVDFVHHDTSRRGPLFRDSSGVKSRRRGSPSLSRLPAAPGQCPAAFCSLQSQRIAAHRDATPHHNPGSADQSCCSWLASGRISSDPAIQPRRLGSCGLRDTAMVVFTGTPCSGRFRRRGGAGGHHFRSTKPPPHRCRSSRRSWVSLCGDFGPAGEPAPACGYSGRTSARRAGCGDRHDT